MKFSAITILTLVAAVSAGHVVDIVDGVVRRQAVVDVEAPAMSDKDGNVVPFDATKVNKNNQA